VTVSRKDSDIIVGAHVVLKEHCTIENKKKYILTMENGDIIDVTLETNE